MPSVNIISRGVQNEYLIAKGTNAAKRYNDISIIQNYALSKAFSIMMGNDCNIFVIWII